MMAESACLFLEGVGPVDRGGGYGWGEGNNHFFFLHFSFPLFFLALPALCSLHLRVWYMPSSREIARRMLGPH